MVDSIGLIGSCIYISFQSPGGPGGPGAPGPGGPDIIKQTDIYIYIYITLKSR